MSKCRWYAGLAVCLLLLSGSQAPVEACTCGRAAPTCTGIDPRDATVRAVFVGTVLSVVAVYGDSPIARAEGIPNRYSIRLRVDEAFTNLGVKEIEVSTNSTSACGYEFTPGETYFVDASPGATDSVFYVGLCSRTKPLADAGDEVELLRAAVRGPAQTRIFGDVWLHAREGGSTRASGGLKVVAYGSGSEYTTITDAHGQFRFVNLPAGSYRIRAWRNDGFSKEATVEPTLSAAQPCAQVDFGFRPGGRIAGTVLDSKATPALGIYVLVKDLTPFGQREQGPDTFETVASRNGRFEIDGLPPGRYATEVRVLTADWNVRSVSVEVGFGMTGAPTAILLLSPNQNVEDVVIRITNPN